MMLKMANKQKIKTLQSADDVHKFIEILKLTFADREMYFTGKYNSRVKASHLLNDTYLNKRIRLITKKAIDTIIPGDPLSKNSLLPIDHDIKPWGAGTVHISIIDKDNNAVSCTPSGGWIRSNEVIPLYTGIKPNHVAVISTGTPVMNPYTLHANASCSSTNTGNIMYITKFWNVGLALVEPSSLCIELEDCLRSIVSTMTPTPKSATPIQESIPPAITPASVTRISDCLLYTSPSPRDS